MALRVVRALFGLVLLLIGLPLLLAGGGLWLVAQHRDDGAYRAPLAEVRTGGHAIVAPDLDSLLRRDAPFVRAGQTTLRLTAHTETGPAFIGLAPADQLAGYLDGVAHAELEGLQLARGPLPLSLAPVNGPAQPPGTPGEQPFWLAASGTGSLEWAPADLRGEPVALVVMQPGAGAPLSVAMVADMRPQWLTSATFGALVLGTVLALLGLAAVVWPTRSRSREIVYVVPTAQVPEVAAHLGVPTPHRMVARTVAEPVEPEPVEPEPVEPSCAGTAEDAPDPREQVEICAIEADSAATPELDPLTDPDDDPVDEVFETQVTGAAVVEAEVAGSEITGDEVTGVEVADAEVGCESQVVDLGEIEVGTADVGAERVAARVVTPRLASASLPPPWPPPAQPWVTAEPAPVPELEKAGQS